MRYLPLLLAPLGLAMMIGDTQAQSSNPIACQGRVRAVGFMPAGRGTASGSTAYHLMLRNESGEYRTYSLTYSGFSSQFRMTQVNGDLQPIGPGGTITVGVGESTQLQLLTTAGVQFKYDQMGGTTPTISISGCRMVGRPR